MYVCMYDHLYIFIWIHTTYHIHYDHLYISIYIHTTHQIHYDHLYMFIWIHTTYEIRYCLQSQKWCRLNITMHRGGLVMGGDQWAYGLEHVMCKVRYHP